jgi:hypothetical protein
MHKLTDWKCAAGTDDPYASQVLTSDSSHLLIGANRVGSALREVSVTDEDFDDDLFSPPSQQLRPEQTPPCSNAASFRATRFKASRAIRPVKLEGQESADLSVAIKVEDEVEDAEGDEWHIGEDDLIEDTL